MLPNRNTSVYVPSPDASTDVAEPANVHPGMPYPNPPGYELREEIGKGGMGVVFRARDHGMNRSVAVKILQDRFAPDSLSAARFVEEAQITGQLQHPGIPAVYHVANLADGRPFLAMKLIRGETLDALVKTNAPINRLAVFESICQALGYAHAHDVIHRDLKPANVMVGAFGEVQVMDWGLAKVLPVSRETKSSTDDEPEVQRPTAGTDSTQAGSVMGTPAYMPPEQAAGDIDKVDQRSDVFGLGAILCVLLTGKPPYVGPNADHVRQLAAKCKTDDAIARLDQCAAEPGVVALCKQCLRADPAARPADANAIARIVGDLRREAEDRARQAELDKAKAEVFAAEQRKRRRVWLGLAVALLVGVVVSSGLALWANYARGQADQARQKETTARETAQNAQREEAKAKQLETAAREKAEQSQRDEAKAKKEAIEQAALASGVNHFLQYDLLELGDPATQQREQGEGLIKMDPDLKLRDVILRAAKTIEGKFADQPLVEAKIRGSLGYTLQGMGSSDLAIPQYERMRQLYIRHRGPDHPDTLFSMHNLAASYAAAGRAAEALALYEETLALRKQKLGPDHPDTLESMSNLAVSYAAAGRAAEALTLREATLGVQKLKMGPDHPDTLASMSNLANSYAAAGRAAEALMLYEKTLTLRKQKLGPDHPHTLRSMINLAISYAAAGRAAEALTLREATLALRKQKLGPDHPDTLRSMTNLANSYHALGRSTEAHNLYEESLALRKQKLGPDHPDTLLSMVNLAISLFRMARYDAALSIIREAMKLAAQAEAAGKRTHPGLIPKMIAFQVQIAAQTRDPALSREAADNWEKLGQTDAGSLYDAACYRSLTAGFLKDRSEAKIEADKAIEWLKKAIAAGFDKDRGSIEKADVLDALRDRADFKELVASLPYLAPPPRAVK